MPRLEPFEGLRYLPELAPTAQVIAPPYDVISATQRGHLASRHHANAVLVELPEADLATGRDRYVVATDLFREWQAEGILVADPEPCLYPYRMTDPSGRTTTGVIGALGLPEPGAEHEDVLPHEQTLPKPKSDRLDLLRATRANLSPIWGLSMSTGVTATFDPTDDEPVADAYDDDAVRHQLWVLSDPDAIAAVSGALASAPVVLADGHHRYETARAYQAERRAAGQGHGAHDLVMALVVELSEDQLTVGAIHRTVSGLPEGFDLVAALAPWFEVVRAGAADERTLGALRDSHSLAMVTGGDAYLLLPHTEVAEQPGNDLDSHLLASVLDGLPPHDVEHRHSVPEAMEALASGEGQAAFLLRPVTVAQIARWASAGTRMPPKSTYFSPKPRTGMVFRSLDRR